MRPNQSVKEENERMIRKHADMVYRLAYSYVRNRSDADDVFQEAFLRYVKTQPEFESDEHCRAWLVRVTVNCAKNHLTSAWRRHTEPLDEKLYADRPQQEQRLAAALRDLKPQYRAVIHLHYFEGYRTEEIAQMLGRKPSTIRSQLARAQLEKIIKEELL